MEDMYHRSPENTGNAELTMESTETEPWGSIGVSNENIILSASQCSEEHVLKCTFNACDPEQTGEVSVFRIIEYLQEMTGQSSEDLRFQSLYTRLDPEQRGITVDFPTFHQVMKDWIADCQKDGREEVSDQNNNIRELQQGNKQLARQNIKLQRTIENAEELNLRLSEEIVELKGKLRGNQQVLEQAKELADELEDLKFFSRSLEEENSVLHTQIRQLEKEQQSFLVQADNLQEENRKLLLEKESCVNKIKQLCTEKAKMKTQLYECENLISSKDTELNKKEKQTEELTATLEEYQMMVQELKLEVNRLQEQLYPSLEDGEGLLRNSQEIVTVFCVQAPARPLSVEIEESLQEFDEEDGLPSPLFGTLPSFMTRAVASEECGASLIEDLTRCSDKMETSTHSDLGEEDECTANLPEITGDSSAELCELAPEEQASDPVSSRCEPAPEEQASDPVHRELAQTGGKKPRDKWFASLTERFLDVPLRYLLLLILQILMLIGLLFASVSLLAIIYIVPPYGHNLVWAEPRGLTCTWPYLHFQYLLQPPV